MTANDKQVGGTHYRKTNSVQHWDFVLEHRLPYMEAQITRYLTRYKKKGGVSDLEKMTHYVEKLLEHFLDSTKHYRMGFIIFNYPDRVPWSKLQVAYDLTDDLELTILRLACSWWQDKSPEVALRALVGNCVTLYQRYREEHPEPAQQIEEPVKTARNFKTITEMEDCYANGLCVCNVMLRLKAQMPSNFLFRWKCPVHEGVTANAKTRATTMEAEIPTAEMEIDEAEEAGSAYTNQDPDDIYRSKSLESPILPK